MLDLFWEIVEPFWPVGALMTVIDLLYLIFAKKKVTKQLWLRSWFGLPYLLVTMHLLIEPGYSFLLGFFMFLGFVPFGVWLMGSVKCEHCGWPVLGISLKNFSFQRNFESGFRNTIWYPRDNCEKCKAPLP